MISIWATVVFKCTSWSWPMVVHTHTHTHRERKRDDISFLWSIGWLNLILKFFFLILLFLSLSLYFFESFLELSSPLFTRYAWNVISVSFLWPSSCLVKVVSRCSFSSVHRHLFAAFKIVKSDIKKDARLMRCHSRLSFPFTNFRKRNERIKKKWKQICFLTKRPFDVHMFFYGLIILSLPI